MVKELSQTPVIILMCFAVKYNVKQNWIHNNNTTEKMFLQLLLCVCYLLCLIKYFQLCNRVEHIMDHKSHQSFPILRKKFIQFNVIVTLAAYGSQDLTNLGTNIQLPKKSMLIMRSQIGQQNFLLVSHCFGWVFCIKFGSFT